MLICEMICEMIFCNSIVIIIVAIRPLLLLLQINAEAEVGDTKADLLVGIGIEIEIDMRMIETLLQRGMGVVVEEGVSNEEEVLLHRHQEI